MKDIAFIGIGVMGGHMAYNLMKNGYTLHVYTRTKDKADEIVKNGAHWHNTITECVKDAEAVITMVGFPKDVEDVYFGEGGILANANPGSFVIDMTTTDPNLSVRIYEAAKKKGISALDAPVSGGDSGAKNAALAIMAGGDREAFEACMPLFTSMGKKITYAGGAGCGQHVKMTNQIALAGAIAGTCEAFEYACKAGINPEVMLEAISAGAAGSWQLSNQTPKLIKKDYAPGFYIKHFIKDMKIASGVAAQYNTDLAVLNTVLDMYKKLENDGDGDLGTQALIKYYED